MLKVNNKRAIKQLAKSSFKANRFRNLFAIVAIILTTVLFTGLFTVVSSLLSSMEESTMRQVGTSAHGRFKYLNQEQYDRLKTHKSIQEISYSVVLAIAENPELAKRPSEIRYSSDQVNAKRCFAFPTTGHLPQSQEELATDTLVLEKLGIKPELGQPITLQYSLAGKKISHTFTLVGLWEGDGMTMASQIWLSPDYVKQQLAGYVPMDKNDFIGKMNANVHFANSSDIEGKLQKVIIESGYTIDEIAIGVNWAYTGNRGSMDLVSIIGGVLIILMITFCGYLIISNVFYISVAKDIRFYGLLKTIGTTGKQLKYLIRTQVFMLCLVGVPLGLLAGYLVGAMLTPMILSILNTNVIKVSLSPLAFVASALFAMATVFISISKPSKLAARVSPMEALGSTESQATKKRKKKSRGVALRRMAFANVFRNRKRAVLVMVSLSLSLIILNVAYSMANSFDLDKYVSRMINNDFVIGDISCFNVHLNYFDQDTLSQELLAEIAAKKGVETMGRVYFAEPLAPIDPHLANLPAKLEKDLGVTGEWLGYVNQTLEGSQLVMHLYGIDENVLKEMNLFAGTIDQEKFASGDYVLATPYDAEGRVNYYNVGDKVVLPLQDGSSKEYEVLAVANIPYNISIQHSHPVEPGFFLPEEIFLQEIAEKEPMRVTINVADSEEADMEAFLAAYCEKTDQNLQYTSKATYIAEFENTQRTYKSVGMVLGLLLAFIGIMNFINTITTSIMARKQELAMLQSIGMTNKQTEAMLIWEGLIYTGLTALFALTIGSLLGYLGVSAWVAGSAYFSMSFTIVPSLLCLPALAVLSVLVPYISQCTINKNSVVERLREVE